MPEEKEKSKTLKKVRTKAENRDKKSYPGPKAGVLDTVKNRAGFIEKVRQFLLDVKVEFKKVVWPSRKQTTSTTGVVILVVFIVALFLGVIDMALAKLIRVFIK